MSSSMWSSAGRADGCAPGFFKNPILAGNRADPSVLKDGKDYYMVHSSSDYVRDC